MASTRLGAWEWVRAVVMDDGRRAATREGFERERETDIFDSFVTTRSGWRRTGGDVRSFSRRFAHGDERGDALCRADHSDADNLRRAHAGKVVDVGDGDEGFAAGQPDASRVVQTGRV